MLLQSFAGYIRRSNDMSLVSGNELLRTSTGSYKIVPGSCDQSLTAGETLECFARSRAHAFPAQSDRCRRSGRRRRECRA